MSPGRDEQIQPVNGASASAARTSKHMCSLSTIVVVGLSFGCQWHAAAGLRPSRLHDEQARYQRNGVELADSTSASQRTLAWWPSSGKAGKQSGAGSQGAEGIPLATSKAAEGAQANEQQDKEEEDAVSWGFGDWHREIGTSSSRERRSEELHRNGASGHKGPRGSATLDRPASTSGFDASMQGANRAGSLLARQGATTAAATTLSRPVSTDSHTHSGTGTHGQRADHVHVAGTGAEDRATSSGTLMSSDSEAITQHERSHAHAHTSRESRAKQADLQHAGFTVLEPLRGSDKPPALSHATDPRVHNTGGMGQNGLNGDAAVKPNRADNADIFGILPPLPLDFDWRAYIKWNPEVQELGIRTRQAAEKHYLDVGHKQRFVYKDFTLALRYTACGGLTNQLYCHVAALALAHLVHAKVVIWPPVQERASFNFRYHTDASVNEQSWSYLDASHLFDMQKTRTGMQEEFGISVVKHPPNTPIPDMTAQETAFQLYPVDRDEYHYQARFRKPIYLARYNPDLLARAIMFIGRYYVAQHGSQPNSILLDLPCTMFAMDVRQLPVVQEIVNLIHFSPRISRLASKVARRIKERFPGPVYNGVHLRMERDAADWAVIMGGREQWWAIYKATMARAQLSAERPLYVASGLIKVGRSDQTARREMELLSKDMLESRLAKSIVFKEMFLSENELDSLSNEQSGLLDMLVLRHSHKFVGVGVSTFSFSLYQMRLIDGRPPSDTALVMASHIGTDELFFSCAVLATQTQHVVIDPVRKICQRECGVPCFTHCPNDEILDKAQ